MDDHSTKFEFLQGLTIVPSTIPHVTPVLLGQLLTMMHLIPGEEHAFRRVGIRWQDQSISDVSRILLPGETILMGEQAGCINFLMMTCANQACSRLSVIMSTQNMSPTITDVCPIIVMNGENGDKFPLHTVIGAQYEKDPDVGYRLILNASPRSYIPRIEMVSTTPFWEIENFPN